VTREQGLATPDGGDEKLLAIGRGSGGRSLLVIYLLDPDDAAFVIHARVHRS
jgi:hypothetical protein